MSKRGVIKKGFYAVRKKDGTISDVVDIGKSIRMDRLTKTDAKRIPKTKGGIPKIGYGHLGDYPVKKKSRSLW
jgi:hypothetical protein